ncbi:MAG: Spy/CpxP family protein refolding chaperone, partial [Pseudolabrys sp.]
AAQRQNQQAVLAAAATPNARNATRRNGAPRVSPQAARQGRFAARAQARAAAAQAQAGPGNRDRARPAFVAARRAWREHRRAGFTPWFGPVFYPYAYADIFNYAFWPGGYDQGYWDYAYDDFFDGVFYGDVTPPVVYGDAGPPAGEAGQPVGDGGRPIAGTAAPPRPRPSYAAVQQLCKQPGTGVTAWPFDEISQKVGLNADQKALLDDMKAAAKQAAQAFAASCPAENAAALTPPGRLQAMTARLEVTQEAVLTVKPALDKFYASLSDEQKERFNQLGPQNNGVPIAADAETTASGSADQGKSACGEPKPGLTNLPIEQIEDAVKPTDAQEANLTKLENATTQAVSKLAAACPDETPLTPPGRLDAMAKRLDAMIDAAKTVKPALNTFYGSLNSEQKARFDAIGRTLAKNAQ